MQKFVKFLFLFFLLVTFFFRVDLALAYSTNMSASVVIGQTDFATSTGGTTQIKLNTTRSVFVDPTGRLIVSESGNNRVLIWNSVPTQNGVPADLVLGQADFTHGSANRGGSIAANTFNSPQGIWSDGQKLFVGDQSNNRVLLWNTFPTTNGQAADIVIGQPDFISALPGCTASKTQGANGVFVYNGKLFVSVTNSSQNRVLIWNSIPTTNGADADLVIGQTSLTTCTIPGISASTFNSPRNMVVTDDGKLILDDNGNKRVLIFNSVPTTNGASADIVIGQPNFTSNTPQTTANGLSNPQAISFRNGRLFIADLTNNRVLIYNSIPVTNSASADIVVGAPNFTTINTGTSATQLNGVLGVFATDNQLFVSDATNNRILIFPNIVSTPGLTLSSPSDQGNGILRLTGTASVDTPYIIKNVEYSVNGSAWSGAGSLDGNFDETNEDYYFNFDPKSNQPRDTNGNLIDGYTVRIRSTNNNADVTDRLFYFSPFDQISPLNNSTVSTSYPQFSFSVNRQQNLIDNLSKYQIQVKQGSSDSLNNANTPWQTIIDDIPVDFNSNNGNGVYETTKLTAIYSVDSSHIQVTSKVFPLSGNYQWKVVAVDKSGHTQETGTRNILVNPNSTSIITNTFPLAILNISGLGNPHLNSYNPSNIKSIYYTSSTNPTFYGIAWTGSKVTLKLTEESCPSASSGSDCTKTYTTIANAKSRWGINIPKGELKSGRKYTVSVSTALEEKYNELPQFILRVRGV
ncbi:MAG TPA: NHL repeat-containing protein [Alphaproteobacteria bacterium]|jgi:hypothetical protein|nr:NHL repeat-containing protein [Alphaproteobacteria bacterium]